MRTPRQDAARARRQAEEVLATLHRYWALKRRHTTEIGWLCLQGSMQRRTAEHRYEAARRLLLLEWPPEHLPRLIGATALRYAEGHSLPLSAYSEAGLPPRTGLTLAQARALEPRLVYVDPREAREAAGPVVGG